MATVTCEVVVLVDANGDYATGSDDASAIERYEETIGSLNDAGGYRFFRLTLTLPAPEAVEIKVEVPEEEETAKVTIK